mmetsp:Transcript_20342/g.65027  ORF Transcript_20342/g.65027 Transcript_20342/m.65027 type:complete len:261 (-) Transcript_20342:49-831(-)
MLTLCTTTRSGRSASEPAARSTTVTGFICSGSDASIEETPPPRVPNGLWLSMAPPSPPPPPSWPEVPAVNTACAPGTSSGATSAPKEDANTPSTSKRMVCVDASTRRRLSASSSTASGSCFRWYTSRVTLAACWYRVSASSGSSDGSSAGAKPPSRGGCTNGSRPMLTFSTIGEPPVMASTTGNTPSGALTPSNAHPAHLPLVEKPSRPSSKSRYTPSTPLVHENGSDRPSSSSSSSCFFFFFLPDAACAASAAASSSSS